MKYILFIIFLIFSFQLKAQEYLHPQDRVIDSLYRVLKSAPDSYENQRRFFDAFPKKFDEFYEMYKCIYPIKNPMCYIAYKHILEGFAKLDKIPKKEYYTRLIELSIGGNWEVDAVSHLMEVLRKKTETDPDLMFQLLSRYPSAKVYSFWFFYFNSLLPLKGGIPKFLVDMKGKYPRVYKELERAFKASDGQAIDR